MQNQNTWEKIINFTCHIRDPCTNVQQNFLIKTKNGKEKIRSKVKIYIHFDTLYPKFKMIRQQNTVHISYNFSGCQTSELSAKIR